MPVFTGIQAQKRRLWMSLDDEVVGRGNLNLLIKLLIYRINTGFCFWLEYHLEYHLECRAKLATRLHSI